MNIHDKELGLLAIVEVTNACNLRCGYCYLGPLKTGDMTLDVAKRTISEFIHYNQSQGKLSKFYWHGGEPTLRGISFFREILIYAKQLSPDEPVLHALQSNGVELHEEWIELLKEQDLGLGISLDGIDEGHDTGRLTALQGKSGYKVLNTLDRLAGIGIPVGVLFTLHQKNRHELQKVFQFCSDRGFELGMNPLTRTPYRQTFEDYAPMPETYAEAVKELFDLWLGQRNDRKRIKVNPPVGLIRSVLTHTGGGECSHSPNCNEVIMSVRPNGDVYPCNRFSGIDGFSFGNIVKDGLFACLQHPNRGDILLRRYNRIEACSTCDIATMCNGGCMGQAHGEYGTIFREDPMCQAYREIIRYAIKILKTYVKNKEVDTHEKRTFIDQSFC